MKHCSTMPSSEAAADRLSPPAGVPREEAKDAIFWDLFEVRNPHTGELAEPWVPCEAAAAKGQKFVLHKVRLSSAADKDRVLTMRFRQGTQPPSCHSLITAAVVLRKFNCCCCSN